MQNSLGTVVANAIGGESKTVLFFHANTLFDLLLPSQHTYYHIIKPMYPVLSTQLANKGLSQTGVTLNIGILNNFTSETRKYTNTLYNLHAPNVLIQHNITLQSNQRTLDYIASKSGKVDRVVFPSQFVKDFWGTDGEVIPYGFVEQEKIEKDIDVLVACNVGENTKLLNALLARNKSVVAVGHNGNLTKPYGSLKDLTSLMKRAKFTVCLTPDIEPPLFAMLAMSCFSCPIVNGSPMAKELIENEKNGFLITDVNEVSVIVKSTSNSRVSDMQERAAETILTQYPRQAFEEKFNGMVEEVSKEIYIR